MPTKMGCRLGKRQLKQIDQNIDDLNVKADISKFSKFNEFLKTHCTARNYFFQDFECNDSNCKYHKSLRGNHSIDAHPDPIAYLENDTQRYKPGSDPEEKQIPSVLEDVSILPSE